jgi:hypothetical protein
LPLLGRKVSLPRTLGPGKPESEQDQAEEEGSAEGVVENVPQPVRQLEKSRIVHIAPQKKELGLGCWKAVRRFFQGHNDLACSAKTIRPPSVMQQPLAPAKENFAQRCR